MSTGRQKFSDDFAPRALVRRIDALRQLLEARTQLVDLLTRMDGKAGAEGLIAKMLKDPVWLETLASDGPPVGGT
jgi:type VI secretion system protein ImpB